MKFFLFIAYQVQPTYQAPQGPAPMPNQPQMPPQPSYQMPNLQQPAPIHPQTTPHVPVNILLS